ncbi:phage tail tube protein [Clostridium tagluense]|uniref:phage tail tube protein n=1 Tax=Clostridium tagluense TaxID=360422 RepID=UPI001CF41C85|nr:phage tail tube protein [Clostridium tagluense]MCB2310653.1 phage tail tube protein [Clostridium tagluense]MCB2315616.1 phage tail tube protein [Clostridium tagluense]MCB2320470.1 phage tail tube protein [Clostridium tagluense]MCB2325247.1 phage tail tube protein [Clostridium tagluense]MCB2330099.1 phage tail tube protein [Clostridium tagluense]
MSEIKGNEVLSANEGSVFVNGETWSNIEKVDAKATAEFEDINFVGDPKTKKRYKGFKIEGSVSMKKIDSRVSYLIADGIRTGNMPEIKIIARQGKLNGQSERVALIGVVFSELTLVQLEAGALVSEELPLTAEDFEYLDRIK